MENASKALLIAGGILIAIILVSLVLLVRSNVVNFYASEDELQAISDKTKFNEQFTRYNRDDVEGYELISLANKIIDYNERLSTATSEGNDSQAEPVRLAITLWNNTSIGKDKVKELLSNDNELRLFEKYPTLVEENVSLNKNNVEKNNVKQSNLYKVLGEVNELKKIKKIELLTKHISNIVIDSNLTRIEGNVKIIMSKIYTSEQEQIIEKNRQTLITAISKINSILGKNYNISASINDLYETYLTTEGYKLRKEIYEYYEYTQFTKAKFKCTKMEYSPTTGRVTNLEFVFTGEIE